MRDNFVIEPLAKHHERKEFNCGNHELNEFLHKYAHQNQKKNISKTYIATPKKTRCRIAGFYSLTSGQLHHDTLPNNSHPRYPVAVARIARLAIDTGFQKIGIGEYLLYDALKNIKNASAIIGIYAVVVDAKNESAQNFYKHYGFMPLQNSSLTMFLPMSTINKLS